MLQRIMTVSISRDQLALLEAFQLLSRASLARPSAAAVCHRQLSGVNMGHLLGSLRILLLLGKRQLRRLLLQLRLPSEGLAMPPRGQPREFPGILKIWIKAPECSPLRAYLDPRRDECIALGRAAMAFLWFRAATEGNRWGRYFFFLRSRIKQNIGKEPFFIFVAAVSYLANTGHQNFTTIITR